MDDPYIDNMVQRWYNSFRSWSIFLNFVPLYIQYLGEVFFSLVNSAFICLGAKVRQVVLWVCHQGSMLSSNLAGVNTSS